MEIDIYSNCDSLLFGVVIEGKVVERCSLEEIKFLHKFTTTPFNVIVQGESSNGHFRSQFCTINSNELANRLGW